MVILPERVGPRRAEIVDVVVATPAQLDRWRDVVGMIYRPALRDGIVAYARA